MPVTAILNYMRQYKFAADSQAGCFFHLENGAPLTRVRLVRELRLALREAGVETKDYAGHSFRIGAATTAASCGCRILTTPRPVLCSVAGMLAGASEQLS